MLFLPTSQKLEKSLKIYGLVSFYSGIAQWYLQPKDTYGWLSNCIQCSRSFGFRRWKTCTKPRQSPLPLQKCLVTEGKNLFKNHLPIRSTNPTSMGQVKNSENHFRYLLYCVENEHFLLQYIFCFGQNSMLETCTDMMIVSFLLENGMLLVLNIFQLKACSRSLSTYRMSYT